MFLKIESINDYLIKPINKIDLSDECKKLTSLYDDNNLVLNLNDTIKMVFYFIHLNLYYNRKYNLF